VPLVDLADETYVVADPEVVAAAVADPARWSVWWPDLVLTVREARGRKGVRWTVGGALVGSCEIWLEPVRDGVVVHYFLRADLASRGGPASPRRAERLRRARTTAWKRSVNALKDELEGSRPLGEPRAPAASPPSRGPRGLPRRGG
jgi:hypothetical protein